MRRTSIAVLVGALALTAVLLWLWTLRRASEVVEHVPPPLASGVSGVPAASFPPGEQPIAPGQEVVIELLEPPATRYADPPPSGIDHEHAGVLAALVRKDVVYDPLLGRAARELANQQAIFDGTVPDDVLDFVLRSSGAIDLGVLQGYSATNREDMGSARTQVEQAVARAGGARVHVGIGEVWKLGAPLPRVLGVLVSKREIEIEPAPRRVEPGETWTLRGTLPSGVREPSALLMHGVAGRIDRISVATNGSRFSVDVVATREDPTFTVSLSGVGKHGSMPLVQLPVAVGRDPASSLSTRLAPDESAITTVERAEALALAILNGDRRRFGLAAVERDRQLDAVARAHSEDMRDHRFFGHVSPTTGGPSDRLAAARVRTSAHGENVATGNTLHELEVALLGSLPHRQNLLSDAFSRVGIGVATHEDNGRRVWHLTQLFGQLAEAIDAEDWRRRLEQSIASSRQEQRVPALTRDSALDRITAQHARLPEQDANRSQVLLDAVSRAGLTRTGAIVWVAAVVRFDQVQLPARVTEEPMRRFGLTVYQPPDDPHGMVRVALVLTGE